MRFLPLLLFLSSALPASAQRAVHAHRPAADRHPGERLGGATSPNVLVIVADDLGVDMVGVYGEGGDLPATPNIDSLATGGVLFRNAYSHPVCTPSRGTIITGRYAFRHGLGFIMSETGVSLDPAELTLPEMLDAGTSDAYTHGAFGKWHLSNDLSGGNMGPNLTGFDHFSGVMSVLLPPENYSNWTQVTNGVSMPSTQYEPQVVVDDAIAWMNAQTQPFLCYLAFSLPHAPYHRPPDTLHNIDFTGVDPDPEVEPRPYYKAMVEAVDTLVGQVLASVDPLVLADTVIVFTSDNGTPQPVTVAPFVPEHAKATVFEGGINVPFIVSGPPVAMPGTESDAFVYLGDIYATVAEAAGVDFQALAPTTTFDAISVYPYLQDPATPSLRSTVYSEIFYPNGSPPADPLDFQCTTAATPLRGGALYTNLAPGQTVACQEDVGFGGPGQARLEICGLDLIEGTGATLTIVDAPPRSMGWLFEGEGLDPMPFGMGQLVPSGPYLSSSPIVSDTSGFYTQTIPFSIGYEALYFQAAFLSVPTFTITNVVKARMSLHGAAIRNDRFKLMIDTYHCEESFFDLVADPFEQNDLLMGTLDPTEQQNYDDLRAELTALMNS